MYVDYDIWKLHSSTTYLDVSIICLLLVQSRLRNIVLYCQKEYKTQPESQFMANKKTCFSFQGELFWKSQFKASNEIMIHQEKKQDISHFMRKKLEHS